MEYIDSSETVAAQTKRILCCECGTAIEPNASNMCVGCLRSHVDISEGIPKQTVLHFCRGCERYLNPPAEWVQCALESRELLALCLKKLKGLSQVKLIDAGFVWTEPHSKRIKVKLTVHAEVVGGAVLQQVFVVDYVINHQMCSACHRSEAQDFWRALVQVRQKAENKKTFYYLEQLILKHKAHENALGIKPIHDGLDFYYSTDAHARKMVDFLAGVLPCRCQRSKKLVSHDIHSNTYNYKFTFGVEIVPMSRESLVCLPRGLAQQLAGISQLCLVLRTTSALHLIDPRTAQTAELSSTAYWRQPFRSVCDPRQLVEYVVMDLEAVLDAGCSAFPGQGDVSTRHVLADVWLVRAYELGRSHARTLHVRTHLGHVLKIGDSVLGYNLQDSNINDANYDRLDAATLPDVVLVKKHYGDRRRHRSWKLKRLTEDDTAFDPAGRYFDEFLDDLEEDPGLRQNVNIFKSGAQIPVDSSEDTDPSRPCITLEEMLDDLQIDDVEMT